MKKWLLVLLISASSPVLAAEDIVHEGKEGTFFEADKAKKLLKLVEVDHPTALHKIENLEKKVELQADLIEISEKKSKVDVEIAEKWRVAYESASKQLAERDEDDDLALYITVGVFLGGTIVGACIMYGSSALLNNLR